MIDDGRLYVSMKAVIVHDRRALLLRKFSGRWDLPGGRLDPGETPTECLLREIDEETRLRPKVGRMLHRWVRNRDNGPDVFVVSHMCRLVDDHADPTLSDEHEMFRWVQADDLSALQLSDGIERSLRRAFKR